MSAYAIIKGNVCEINFQIGGEITVKAKTNSKFTQRVTLKSADQSVDYVFTGGGERNTVIGQSSFKSTPQVTATFEYAETAGEWKPSKLNYGGPYAIGSYNMLVIVAENGDDSDYNDSILEFSWYTSKG